MPIKAGGFTSQGYQPPEPGQNDGAGLVGPRPVVLGTGGKVKPNGSVLSGTPLPDATASTIASGSGATPAIAAPAGILDKLFAFLGYIPKSGCGCA